MDLGMSGRPALVTGASSGLGYATAASLAAEGARVAIASRDRGRIDAAADRLRSETGGRIVPLVGDLGTAEGPARLVSEAVEALGGLAILVTNAGGPPPGAFDDVGEDEFGRAIELTFRSVERLVRAALPYLEADGDGRIVNLTSITAKEPHEGLLLSNALRPAVHGLAKSLAKELGRRGVTVNSICTGFTRTERLDELARATAARRGIAPSDVLDEWRARIPRGELGRPREIGDVVAFLCSRRASFVNGVSIPVDGGESHSTF